MSKINNSESFVIYNNQNDYLSNIMFYSDYKQAARSFFNTVIEAIGGISYFLILKIFFSKCTFRIE